MKKKQLIVFFSALFLFASFSFAQTNDGTDEELKDWSGTNSGDYVIYKDFSWKTDTWIGFLYYDKNTVGAFLYTDEGETFVKILFSS